MEEPSKHPCISIRAKVFHFISEEDIFKEIKILYNSKSIQESDLRNIRQLKENDYFFAQLMNKYFNGHENNTGFSTKFPGEENSLKQIDKSVETDHLLEIPSSGN